VTAAATAMMASGGTAPAVVAPAGSPDALNPAIRDQIDALRAAADLLVLHPVEDAWVAVSAGSIQLMPGGDDPGHATAVASIAARLGATAEITRHHGRTWHTAAGHLGRHRITVFAALDEEETSR
jgi:hypothetical protein